MVLVGVSRTSKTPLSIYLGYLGYKAANVPLVKGIDPPEGLFEVDPAKVVGVTLQAELLAEIRGRRMRDMRGSTRAYARLEDVYAELEHADAVFRRLGCPVIEVSTLAIEETAHRIIRLVELRLAERERRPRRARTG
jgi:regulator of PEP synthase PpsR (kinase-PPPase family)